MRKSDVGYSDRKKLDILEREVRVKELELEQKILEGQKNTWKSPLFMAIITAALGLVGTAGSVIYSSNSEMDLAEFNAESQRILEMVKLTDPEKVKKNLQFLIDADLIKNKSVVAKILDYYKSTDRSDWPGKSDEIFVHKESGIPISEYLENSDVQRLAKSIGMLVLETDKNNEYVFLCTAFLVASNKVATARNCVTSDYSKMRFEIYIDDVLKTYKLSENSEHVIDIYNNTHATLYLESDVNDVGFLALDPRVRVPGVELSMIYSTPDRNKKVIWNNPNCIVLHATEISYVHRCDVSQSTVGAPLIDTSSMSVIGVHYGIADVNGAASKIKD